MLRSSINHASEIESLIQKLNDPETIDIVIDSALLYSRMMEECRQCITKGTEEERLALVQGLECLVAKSPKLFLPYWNLFVPLTNFTHPRPYLKASVDFWKIAVRGSTGMLKSRTRFAAKNKATSRSFTTLSETVASCLRILWLASINLLDIDTELALNFMRTVSRYNCLGGFLEEEELLDLLESVCWDHLEVFPRASMQIACSVAQSLKSVNGDNGLALRYISAASKDTGLDLVGPFFALLDIDDGEVWLTALSVLTPYIGDETLLCSYGKIIEIVLETSIKEMLLNSLWNVHLLPMVKKTPMLSHESVWHLLKCIKLLTDKFDFGPHHQTIIDALYHLREEKILAQVYQIVGVFASPNYAYTLQSSVLDSVATFILEGKAHPKLMWAAANLASNYRVTLSSEHLTSLSQLARNSLGSTDEVEQTSAIRCDLEISLMCNNMQECIARIEGLLGELSAPKVLWTCANSIKRASDKGHLIPGDVVHRLVTILESTSYYKVAISVTQCLSGIKRNGTELEEQDIKRIRTALSGQRFTITDSYSERYQQSLRSSNSELLSLLDLLEI